MTPAAPAHPLRPGALAALAATLVVVAVLVGAGCSSGGDGDRTGSTATSAPATTAPATLPPGAVAEGLRSLRPGQCFLLPTDDPAAEDRAVWLVGCDQPHTHEVVDVVEYGGGSDGGRYPGVEAVRAWAEDACYVRFEPFVGRAWTRSELDLELWWPSEESWELGDRSVICTVFPADRSPVTGTVRGSAR